jgi:hypothetical protein
VKGGDLTNVRELLKNTDSHPHTEIVVSGERSTRGNHRDVMPFANSDLLFEDPKLLVEVPPLARPEVMQIRSTNETKRATVAAVAQDRKATLQSKESTRVAVKRRNQVITWACPR